MSECCPHGMCQHNVACEVEGCCVDAVCENCGEYSTGCYCCDDCGTTKVRIKTQLISTYYCPACEEDEEKVHPPPPGIKDQWCPKCGCRKVVHGTLAWCGVCGWGKDEALRHAVLQLPEGDDDE